MSPVTFPVCRALILVALYALAQAGAHASTVQRSYTPRFDVTTRGELLIVGNTLMTCPGTGTACSAAQAGGAADNNGFSMVWVNSDNVLVAPLNSSTAQLNIPAGSTVLFAGLYWGADTSGQTAALNAPTPANRGIVRFATPASGYASTTATQVDLIGTRFSAFANVTARVQAGGSGTYKVSGIQAGQGGDRYAGWALVVVVANPSLPPRNMVVFDGYAVINSTAPTTVTTTVSGFRTPPAGAVNTRVGAVAFEGDRANTGDSLQLNGTNLSNGLNPAGNFFNSSITYLGNANFFGKNPNYINQLGFDIDVVATNLLGNNATSASLTFTTGGETYFPSVLTFTTEVFEPVVESNLVKSVVDVNGGSIAPGDILEYTLAYANTGNDGTLQTVIADPIPANSTYVPGSLSVLAPDPGAGGKSDAAGDDQAEYISTSPARVVFRVGAGANALTGGTLAPGASGSIRFRVQVNAAAAEGTTIANTATVTFIEQSLGTTVTANSNTVTSRVSNRADLTLTKSNEVTTLTSGATTTYALVLTNNGPAGANGAVLRDPAATGLNCLAPAASGTASCEASGGAQCPGGGLSGTIPVANLQAAGGVAIPTLPAGGQVRVELTCLVTATTP